MNEFLFVDSIILPQVPLDPYTDKMGTKLWLVKRNKYQWPCYVVSRVDETQLESINKVIPVDVVGHLVEDRFDIVKSASFATVGTVILLFRVGNHTLVAKQVIAMRTLLWILNNVVAYLTD